jgi:hypothetical protein
VRIVVVAERGPFFRRLRITDFSPPSIGIITSHTDSRLHKYSRIL